MQFKQLVFILSGFQSKHWFKNVDFIVDVRERKRRKCHTFKRESKELCRVCDKFNGCNWSGWLKLSANTIFVT